MFSMSAMDEETILLDHHSQLILAELHEKVGDVTSAEYVRREHARVRADA